ncbi:uncharacterized protein [Battus philenor]|uniref:uncharacterized protein n=1 Tax=Battus philenor TaxID=42288 RepID=UPI0035CFB90F
MDARVYDRVRTFHRDVGGELNRVLEAGRWRERRGALATWRSKLSEERYARKCIVGAILTIFEAWMQRRDGRIGREATANCFHWATQDYASHTFADCPAWQSQPRILADEIGQDLTLLADVSAMLSGST